MIYVCLNILNLTSVERSYPDTFGPDTFGPKMFSEQLFIFWLNLFQVFWAFFFFNI